MIRAALYGWALPVAFLGSWYGLASNDINFGTMILSRALFDQVFGMYGALLGIDPALLPGMVAKAIVVDSLIVAGLVALRHRRAILAFARARWTALRQAPDLEAARSDSSLSSAP